MMAGKKILLAVCGSIAAYKAAFFVRLLVREGACVKVIMTESAKNFVAPLTFATLAKNPVFSDYFTEENGEWNNHVELGLWADLMVIAPLSANTLGKLANGICDNLLLATYLSAKCPVIVVPAMDLDMYQHPSVQENLKKLVIFGNTVIEAREGELASGLSGQGRMEEPEKILEIVKNKFSIIERLKGKKVVITSGPTHEAIDPVRFIGNQSSGKMGCEIAKAFYKEGASVTMVSGPAQYTVEEVENISVNSASEMFHEVKALHKNADIIIFAAAVADYRPMHPAKEKIKKEADKERLTLELVKTPDIAEEIGNLKKNQIHIGFALETSDGKTNAKEKRKRKNFDLIVLNSLKDEGTGFKCETNKVTFFDRDNKEVNLALKKKEDVAIDIVNYLIEHLL